MPESAVPDLSRFNDRLASNNARVTRFMDSLAGRIDRILQAVGEKNWREAQRLSQWLAKSSLAHGHPHVADKAHRLAADLAQPHNALGVRESLMGLIGACGAPPEASDEPIA